MKIQKKYYLGLDIGTNSIGYAVTDTEYNLLKFRGEPAWGTTVFDEAALSTERRAFRTARRRLDRRQQRMQFIQELFAKEIVKRDERFFIRLKESALFREDAGDVFTLFNDENYTDKEYYRQYPTIHHLICDLMVSEKPHDARLVYLACAWLVAHRGHFLLNVESKDPSDIKSFEKVYIDFSDYFKDNGYSAPWEDIDVGALAACLKKKTNVTTKTRELNAILNVASGAKAKDDPDFPFKKEGIIKLLAGGKYALKDLFGKEEYAELENKSITLGMDEEKFAVLMTEIGEDYELIKVLKELYDWALLADLLGEASCISEAKVRIYEQHKQDLAFLKRIIKKYKREKYDEVFRGDDKSKSNYVAYAYHPSDQRLKNIDKKANKEDFSKYLLGIVKDLPIEDADRALYEDMLNRLELHAFLPKQKDTDNRVIPHQLYLSELEAILKKAENYLPFLRETDNGLSVSDKIRSVFTFRIPYYVGPLNTRSDHAWIVRKEGRIYPWNFEDMVDLDESENNFIKRMTNTCTYLPGEDVLPKDSLLYHKYTVLNEINNIRVNGEKLSVELKQRIYNELFMTRRKVTRKQLDAFLHSNGCDGIISGIDETIHSDLAPQLAFKNLIGNGVLSEEDVERIIERAAYAEDKSRLSRWIIKNYPQVNDEDRKYICRQSIKDFGRLSRKLLDGIEGVDLETGEVVTVISALWNSQNNLMEILASDKYTFKDEIEKIRLAYFSENNVSLDDRLEEMYISNAVRRPIYRTLAIVKDVTKAFGNPEKIFVETTRGSSPEQKGKRTKSRKEQILELYEKCKDEDVRVLKQQLEAMGDYADNRLQGDKLFLYYMQFGKCMYSGAPIVLEKLATKEYDIDHIYPQKFVKDDSIINNKVLVLSEENGRKSDKYPISEEIRNKMHGYWDHLKRIGAISEEKHKRLTRASALGDDEKMGFINRQLTETSQSTKAVATILKEKYPEAEIVYCRPALVSEFRQEFDLLKSRSFNDLHHAVDAYLNIVTGNVYSMKFTHKWFNVHSEYSLNTKTIFTRPAVCGGETVWKGEESLAKVKAVAVKNNAHFTKFAFFKRGGLFDQMPVRASEGLVPLKKGLSTEKYGGYNKSSTEFFIPVKYRIGKKAEVIIMSVELMFGKKFLRDADFAKEYSFGRLEHILGKKVDELSFPMGMRPWKVNTVLSLDGLRYAITGSASKGAKLLLQVITQFSASPYWRTYIKRIERFVEKAKTNSNYIYDKAYDVVNEQDNLKLYDLYIEKFQNSLYAKRCNSPLPILESGREKFIKLGILEQCTILLAIHSTFGRLSRGCDLEMIGGSKTSAGTTLSTGVSNWKKAYADVRLIDASASGLWEKASGNLLDLL